MTKRCSWVKMTNPLYIAYHDEEWGQPLHDDQALFELLCMETYQAGLSWETVLNKRQAFREAFHSYQIHSVAEMTDTELEAMLENPAIIRNRAKLLLHALTPKLFYSYRQSTALLMPIFGLLLRGKLSLTMFLIIAKPQLKHPYLRN